ncbi:hypothetical protein H8959_022540 [Pygathrix nigripes]
MPTGLESPVVAPLPFPASSWASEHPSTGKPPVTVETAVAVLPDRASAQSGLSFLELWEFNENTDSRVTPDHNVGRSGHHGLLGASSYTATGMFEVTHWAAPARTARQTSDKWANDDDISDDSH